METKNIENPKFEEIKKPKMRKIVIETDGNNINVVESDVAGIIEFRAILINILEKLK